MRRLLVPVGLAIAVGACGAASARTPGSGIVGRVVAGPVCPVETIPPRPACAPRPLVARLVIRPAATRPRPIAVRSDHRGRFRVSLPPGSYVIHALGPAGSPLPRPPGDRRVQVVAGRFAAVTISYDTGIR